MENTPPDYGNRDATRTGLDSDAVSRRPNGEGKNRVATFCHSIFKIRDGLRTLHLPTVRDGSGFSLAKYLPR
jgi:hypothetical protein